MEESKASESISAKENGIRDVSIFSDPNFGAAAIQESQEDLNITENPDIISSQDQENFKLFLHKNKRTSFQFDKDESGKDSHTTQQRIAGSSEVSY
jgi:hypothetical protein